MSDTVTYTLTEQELRTALWKSRRYLPRMAVQSAVLLLLGVVAIINVCLGKGDNAQWLVAVLLPVGAALVWVLPAVSFRREAAALAAAAVPVTLTVSEEAIAAGGVSQPFENAYLEPAGDLLLWRPDKTQLVVIPRRALPEEMWKRLCALV